MSRIITTDSGNRYTRSRWITVRHAYDVTPRHSLWEFVTDGHGYTPARAGFNPAEHGGVYLDYFRHAGRMYALDQFMPLGSVWCGGCPETFTDTDGKLTTIGAVDFHGNPFHPVRVELDEYAERVRVYTPAR